MMDYNSILSRQVQEIKPSGIRRFFELAAEMEDVISLGVGEPDFKTPWAIRQAGITSLERGRTHYSPNAGFQPGHYQPRGRGAHPRALLCLL